jgi:hypothetical protein
VDLLLHLDNSRSHHDCFSTPPNSRSCHPAFCVHIYVQVEVQDQKLLRLQAITLVRIATVTEFHVKFKCGKIPRPPPSSSRSALRADSSTQRAPSARNSPLRSEGTGRAGSPFLLSSSRVLYYARIQKHPEVLQVDTTKFCHKPEGSHPERRRVGRGQFQNGSSFSYPFDPIDGDCSVRHVHAVEIAKVK